MNEGGRDGLCFDGTVAVAVVRGFVEDGSVDVDVDVAMAVATRLGHRN